MAKEFEKAGLPTVQVCTLTSIAAAVGTPRIAAGLGIPYPLGDPFSTPAEEKALRRRKVEEALRALTMEPKEGGGK